MQSIVVIAIASGENMSPLELVKLVPLMERTSGKSEIMVGLIDGPIAVNHPGLAANSIREIPGETPSGCTQTNGTACMHGTLVAGVLCAKRETVAPAICPSCTLLVRPIFDDMTSARGQLPSTTAEKLATAIIECIDAGARILNLSVGLGPSSLKGARDLQEALDYAASRGVIPVVAAGNQGTLGSTALTSHPWAIPVVACDLQGRPSYESNLGNSIGRRGLSAPGDGITSLGADGKVLAFGGTSAATPFVTGTIALLWSEFPAVTAAEIKLVITRTHVARRSTVVPPLLDAWASYQVLATAYQKN